MAMTINTNIQSLNAQRNLTSSQSSLSTSMQRLSSGLRINSAKDDAAGLAIAERMSAQVRGLNQAARNANDGVSLAQTAEGALSTIGGNLQRIRELAVQSRNATNSADDRAALQKEVVQLKSEIDRVAKDTSFNGTNLLDGTFNKQDFQVGANQGQLISIDGIQDAKIESLGTWDGVAQANASGKSGRLTQIDGATSAVAVSFKIDTFEVLSDTSLAAGETLTGAKLDSDMRKFLNTSDGQGYKMTGSFANGDAVISRVDGDSMTIAETGGLTFTGGGTPGVVGTHANGTVATTGNVGFTDLDVSTENGADNAIKAMDAALKTVNSARADLGAIQNRFESVVSNLSVNSENLSASKSRIMDADFASETANLSRSQILQQAGTAMVAQANQLPQGVLSLLR